MALLLELHGDLPDEFPADERRLYIFACSRKPCVRKPGCIRAFRATRKVEIEQQQPGEKPAGETKEDKEEAAQAPKPDLGASLFGASSLTGNISANANPFSSQPSNGNDRNSNSNPFAAPAPAPADPPKPSTEDLSETFADKVRISLPDAPTTTKKNTNNLTTPPEKSSSKEPWPLQSAFPPAYPHYYLDAEHESLSRPATPTIPKNVTIDAADENNGAGNNSAELKDTFESELDKAFLRFSTRLAHNPEQVLRYEFRGEPLLYSYTDDIGKLLHPHPQHQPQGHITTTAATSTTQNGLSSKIPRCQYCTSPRVFELQLVPHAISMLEVGREKLGLDAKDDAGMEWGTVILGVCGGDCRPEEVGVTGWREEWVGVQWEELMK